MAVDIFSIQFPFADIWLLIGRLIFGFIFIMFGLNHLMQLEGLTQYAKAKGVPSTKVIVALTGIQLLFGGLTILLGIYPEIGALAIIVFLIPTTFIMHNFWALNDPQMKMIEMTNFMKNMGLLGACFMFLAIPGPWPLGLQTILGLPSLW